MSLYSVRRMAIKELKLIPVDEILVTTKLTEILQRSTKRPHYMAVVKSKKGKKIQGIITMSSIFDFLGRQETIDLETIDAVKILTRNFVFAKEGNTIDEVRRKLLDNNLYEIPILDGEIHTVKGAITRDSLAYQIIEMAHKDYE